MCRPDGLVKNRKVALKYNMEKEKKSCFLTLRKTLLKEE